MNSSEISFNEESRPDEIIIVSASHGNRRIFHLPVSDSGTSTYCGVETQSGHLRRKDFAVYPDDYYPFCERCASVWMNEQGEAK